MPRLHWANPPVVESRLRSDFLHGPQVRCALRLARLLGTPAIEMAHLEGARIGIGDMDDMRLSRLITQIVQTKNLPRTPGVREVFDRSHLPPPDQRIRSLAR